MEAFRLRTYYNDATDSSLPHIKSDIEISALLLRGREGGAMAKGAVGRCMFSLAPGRIRLI